MNLRFLLFSARYLQIYSTLLQCASITRQTPSPLSLPPSLPPSPSSSFSFLPSFLLWLITWLLLQIFWNIQVLELQKRWETFLRGLCFALLPMCFSGSTAVRRWLSRCAERELWNPFLTHLPVSSDLHSSYGCVLLTEIQLKLKLICSKTVRASCPHLFLFSICTRYLRVLISIFSVKIPV